MDPNETLRQIRTAVMAALALADDYEKDPDPATAEDAEDYLNQLDELAQLVNSLDEWLSRGGFLPAAWAETASTLCQASIDGFHCSRPIHRDDWHHVALTSAGFTRRRWTDDQPDHDVWPEPLGPPNPAHASTELMDQLDRDLAHAGEVVRRMREGR